MDESRMSIVDETKAHHHKRRRQPNNSMLRSRGIATTLAVTTTTKSNMGTQLLEAVDVESDLAGTGLDEQHDDGHNGDDCDAGGKKSRRRRRRRHWWSSWQQHHRQGSIKLSLLQKKRQAVSLVLLVIVCYFVHSTFKVQILLEKNLETGRGSKGSQCPSLPNRLLHANDNYPSSFSSTTTTMMMSREQFLSQVPHMTKTRFGTMGDSILMCKHEDYTTSTKLTSPSCFGVVKIYKSPTVYEHAKRCLTLLAKEDFVPNILYYSDADLTIVEEDRGQLTMMNAAIPLDFDQQIHRMICILHHRYKIIHRDIAYTNFVVDPQTGFVSLIDFGDAFVAHTSSDDVFGVSSSSSSSPPPSMQALKWWKDVDNWNGRNLINLLNIWLSTYDENERVEQFITDTIPHIYGKRQWRPPPQKWRLNTNDETGRRKSHDTRP